jgi:DNA (cytosine-5)-methyltransferase 1
MLKTIDLFCGCGGLTLGAKRAGFMSALGVDADATLTSSFRRNFPSTELLLTDIAKLKPRDVAERVAKIDGILGGPPCQAFSTIGRQRDDDPRRLLLGHFFRLVSELAPRFFVMENVRGLISQKNVGALEKALSLLPRRYSLVGPLTLDAADFGAATTRKRVFVMGFDAGRMRVPTASSFEGNSKPATVRDALSDLHRAKYIGEDERGFDQWQYDARLTIPPYAKAKRGRNGVFTSHKKMTHKPSVVRRFSKVAPGSVDPIGRHARLRWDGQCPTLRAGTGPDQGSYQSVRPLHPDEDRVITVREAARLQGFPDNFLFHPTNWHSFRMIGNSVSPVIAERLMSVIADYAN